MDGGANETKIAELNFKESVHGCGSDMCDGNGGNKGG